MNKRTVTYEVVLTPDEGGTWMVTVPDLPGCITFGTSLAHAGEMARDAISLYLEGESIPKPTAGATAEDGGKVIRVRVDVPAQKHPRSA